MKNILLFEQERVDYLRFMQKGKGAGETKRRVRTRTPAGTSGTSSNNKTDPKADTGTVNVVTKNQEIEKATKKEIPKLKPVVDKRKPKKTKLETKLEKRAGQIGVLNKKGNNTVDQQKAKKGNTPGISDSGAGTGGGTGTEQDYRNQIGTLFGLEFSSNCFDQINTSTALILSTAGGITAIMGIGYATATWSQVAFFAKGVRNVYEKAPLKRLQAIRDQREIIKAFSEEIKKLKSSMAPEMKLDTAKNWWKSIKQGVFRNFWGKLKLVLKTAAQGGNIYMATVLTMWGSMKLLKKADAIALSDQTIDEIAGVALLTKLIDNIFAVMLGYALLDVDSSDEEKLNCAMMYSIIGIAFALTVVGTLLLKRRASPEEFSKLFQTNLSRYGGLFSESFKKTFIASANKIINKARNPEAKAALQELRSLLAGAKRSVDAKGNIKSSAGEGGYEAALKHVKDTVQKFDGQNKKQALDEFDRLGQRMLDELFLGYKSTIKKYQAVAKGTFTTARTTANQVSSKIDSNFAAIQKQIQPPAGNLPLRNPFSATPAVPAVARNIDYRKVTQVIGETERLFFSGDPLGAINLSGKIGKQFVSTVSSGQKSVKPGDAAGILKILKGINGSNLASGGFDNLGRRTLLKNLKELKGAPFVASPAPLDLTTRQVAASYLDDLIFYKFPNFSPAARKEVRRVLEIITKEVDNSAKQALPGKLPSNLTGRLPVYLGITAIGITSSLIAHFVYGGDPIDDVPGAPTEFNGLLPDEVNAFLNTISGTKYYNNILQRLKRTPKGIKGAIQVIFTPGGDNFGADYQKGSNGQNDLEWLKEEIANQGKVARGEVPERINEILVKFATIKQDALIAYAQEAYDKSGKKFPVFGDATRKTDPQKYIRSVAAQHLIVNIIVFKSGLREKLNRYYSNVHNTNLKGPRLTALNKIFKYSPSHFLSVKKGIGVFNDYYNKDQRKEVDKKIEKLRKEKQEREGDQGAPESLLDSPSKNSVPEGAKIKRNALPRRGERYANMIERIGLEEGVNPALFAGLIFTESTFEPDAVSPVGAIGLAQLMPETGKTYGAGDMKIFEPEANIRAGMKALKEQKNVNILKSAMAKNSYQDWDSLSEKEKMKMRLYSYNWGAARFASQKPGFDLVGKDKRLMKGLPGAKFPYGRKGRTNDQLMRAITSWYKTKGGGEDYADKVFRYARKYGWNGKSLFISKSPSKSSNEMPGRSAVSTPMQNRQRALNWKKRLDKYKGRRGIPRLKPRKIKQQGVKEMSKKNIKELVAEMLNENSGQGYAPYPYGSSVRDDEQPREDYVEEWKAFSLELVRDQSRNMAIEVAKLLVKDLELFEDVLDLAGQNQSIGEEILQKLKDSKQA